MLTKSLSVWPLQAWGLLEARLLVQLEVQLEVRPVLQAWIRWLAWEQAATQPAELAAAELAAKQRAQVAKQRAQVARAFLQAR